MVHRLFVDYQFFKIFLILDKSNKVYTYRYIQFLPSLTHTNTSPSKHIIRKLDMDLWYLHSSSTLSNCINMTIRTLIPMTMTQVHCRHDLLPFCQWNSKLRPTLNFILQHFPFFLDILGKGTPNVADNFLHFQKSLKESKIEYL